MWRSKIPQRGVAPTGILRSLAAERRRTLTDLLGEVWFCFIYFIPITSHLSVLFYFYITLLFHHHCNDLQHIHNH